MREARSQRPNLHPSGLVSQLYVYVWLFELSQPLDDLSGLHPCTMTDALFVSESSFS